MKPSNEPTPEQDSKDLQILNALLAGSRFNRKSSQARKDYVKSQIDAIKARQKAGGKQ